MSDSGLLLLVNGTPRRLRAMSLHIEAAARLPVWTADVDGSLGCAGGMEEAVLMAARAADRGAPQEMGDKG